MKFCCTENLSLPGIEPEFLKKSWVLVLYVQISCKDVLPITQPSYIYIFIVKNLLPVQMLLFFRKSKNPGWKIFLNLL